MKSPCVGTLVPNEIITGHFLVITKEIRQKKSGEPYLSLQLADRTGDIEAKMWDNVVEVMNTFDRDDFVKVKGLVQVYQNRSQFTVHRLRRVADQEINFDDFFPCTERDVDEMFAELQGWIGGMRNEHLRALLQAVFQDAEIARRYKIAPAAKTIHHACRGGLLEHVLSLCKLCQIVGPHYKNIDLDLLMTGAILHDIGKIDELSYSRSFSYSTEGQLLGHIVIGLRMVGDKIAGLPDFPPKLRTLLDHMIISHHGELEYGSPKVPLFEEALLLHHLDNLDSKMETLRNAVRRDGGISGEFTGWVAPLERSLLRKERYLNPEEKVERVQVDVEFEPGPTPNGPASNPVAEPKTPQQPTPQQQASQPPAPLNASPQGPAMPHTERPQRREERPVPVSPFAEKLQAVLGLEK